MAKALVVVAMTVPHHPHDTTDSAAFPLTVPSMVTLFSGGVSFSNFSGSASLTGTQMAPAPITTAGHGTAIVAIMGVDGTSGTSDISAITDTVTVSVSVTLTALRNQTSASLRVGCT